jgi:hypothetical protein
MKLPERKLRARMKPSRRWLGFRAQGEETTSRRGAVARAGFQREPMNGQIWSASKALLLSPAIAALLWDRPVSMA